MKTLLTAAAGGLGVLLALGACSKSTSGTGPGSTPDAASHSSGSGSGTATSGSGSGSSGGSGPADAGSKDAHAGSRDATAPDAVAAGEDAAFVYDGAPFEDVYLSPDASAPFTPSASALDWLNDLAVFENGGTIAATDDTLPVTVVIHGDGTHTVTVTGPHDTKAVLMNWTSPGVFTLTADSNADGVVDEKMTATTVGDLTTIQWQIDTGLDGTFAWNDTMTESDQVVSSYLQEAPAGSTTLVPVGAYSGPSIQFGGGFYSGVCADGQTPKDSCNGPRLATLLDGGFPPHPTYCTDAGEPMPCTGDTCCGRDGGPGCVAWADMTPGWKAASLTRVSPFTQVAAVADRRSTS
jgi:hypothetical protein